MSKRLSEIDVLQGIAMTLVVLGHHLLSFMPHWYNTLHYYIYTFHMPLFIFISGFLVCYSYKPVNDVKSYIAYVTKKIRKFVPPYFLVGFACILLTEGVGDVSIILEELKYLFIAPKQGPAVFLWYIYLLFIYYCLTPFYFNLNKKLRWSVLGICLLGFIFPSNSSLFCIDYFTKYSVFFLLGFLVAQNYSVVSQYLVKLTPVSIILFLMASVLHFYGGYNKNLELLMPLLAIPCFYGLSAWIDSFPLRQGFIYVSINCFSIYLFHMFFVQAGGLVMNLVSHPQPIWIYVLYLLFSIFVSLYCSSKIYVVLHKYVPFL